MSNTDTEHVTFIFIIFLVCSLWTHRAGLIQAEHIAKYVLLISAELFGIISIIRFVKKVKRWQRRQNPGIAMIDVMTGLEFESYVARLLKTCGYNNIKLTEEYDYGIDIIATKNGVTWAIQVKRYSGLVGADAVRQVVTALRMYHCDKAMVITNSTFSKPAIVLADANDCILIDKDKLNILTKLR
jgi:restriction system protein